MPSCLSNHNKASPLQSQLLSFHLPVCIALSTSPVSSAPSAQMASRPRWFLWWSQLPLAPPVLGSFLQGPLTVLIPRGTDLGRIPGSSPHHGVPPLPDSGESGNKASLVSFLPSQGGKHTSGILLFLFTRAIRSGRDLRIRAVSFLLPPSLPPSLPSSEFAFLLVSTMS